MSREQEHYASKFFSSVYPDGQVFSFSLGDIGKCDLQSAQYLAIALVFHVAELGDAALAWTGKSDHDDMLGNNVVELDEAALAWTSKRESGHIDGGFADDIGFIAAVARFAAPWLAAQDRKRVDSRSITSFMEDALCCTFPEIAEGSSVKIRELEGYCWSEVLARYADRLWFDLLWQQNPQQATLGPFLQLVWETIPVEHRRDYVLTDLANYPCGSSPVCRLAEPANYFFGHVIPRVSDKNLAAEYRAYCRDESPRRPSPYISLAYVAPRWPEPLRETAENIDVSKLASRIVECTAGIDYAQLLRSVNIEFARAARARTFAGVPLGNEPAPFENPTTVGARLLLPLTPEDQTILLALDKVHPTTMQQCDVESETAISHKTVSKRMKYLQTMGLIEYPFGERSGVIITLFGQQHISKHGPKGMQSTR